MNRSLHRRLEGSFHEFPRVQNAYRPAYVISGGRGTLFGKGRILHR